METVVETGQGRRGGTRASAGAGVGKAEARLLARIGGLDDLLAFEPGELAALYRAARTPTLAEVQGDLRGRMLALVDAPVLAPLGRLLARQAWFPWRGKSFAAPRAAGASGSGINRVFRDDVRWYRFETALGPSRAGDFEAFQLDYDLADNPWFIRIIKDEIRALPAPDGAPRARPLYLGQAYLGRTLALYFALE